MRLRPITLGTALKVRIGFLCALCLLVLISTLSYRAVNASVHAQAMVAHTYKVREQLEALHGALATAEASSRGYLLTGQEQFLEPYRAEAPTLARRLAALKRIVTPTPRLQQGMAALSQAVVDKLGFMERNIALKRAGKMTAAMESQRLLKGRRLMEAVGQVMRAIMQEEDSLLNARQKGARAAATRAQRTVFLGGVPAILLLLVMALFIERDLCWRAAMERALREKERELQAANDQLGAANRHLEVLATQDPLTGLLNRRAMEQRLNAEVARAQRYDIPLSLLLLDVDHFKHYNDTFGHPAGDAVLQRVGALLLREARATDAVGRYGGEEFALLLAATDAAGARLVAERVRAAIAADAWPERAVTVSVGVATFRAHIEGGAAALIAEADKALYGAKDMGRNRVVHFFSLLEGAPAVLSEPDERIKKVNREAESKLAAF